MSQVWKGYLILRALLITTLFSAGASRAVADQERDALVSAHFLGTKEAYQSFLSEHPNSRFAPEVFGILADTFGLAKKAVKPIVKPRLTKPVLPTRPTRPTAPTTTRTAGSGGTTGGQY